MCSRLRHQSAPQWPLAALPSALSLCTATSGIAAQAVEPRRPHQPGSPWLDSSAATAVRLHLVPRTCSDEQNWKQRSIANARLENFKALNTPPQSPVPEAMSASWEQKRIAVTRKRQLGQRFREQQMAEQQQRRQNDTSVNQLRHQRAMAPQPQGRSRGRHADGIPF